MYFPTKRSPREIELSRLDEISPKENTNQPAMSARRSGKHLLRKGGSLPSPVLAREKEHTFLWERLEGTLKQLSSRGVTTMHRELATRRRKNLMMYTTEVEFSKVLLDSLQLTLGTENADLSTKIAGWWYTLIAYSRSPACR